MRTFGTLILAAAVASVAGCGGSSPKGATSSSGRSAATGGQCPASSGGQTCTGEDAYTTCVTSHCSDQIKSCFGANYTHGDFSGGSCADWMTCEMACPCDAATKTSCESTCATQFMTSATGQACLTCVTGIQSCGAAAGCVQPTCTTTTATNTSTSTMTQSTTSTSTTTSTGTGCAAAAACCTSLGATYGATIAQSCTQALAGQTDAVCAQLVASYKQAGVCP